MQIVSGMRYLHTHGILHRDLSLTNLLLTSDLKVKIADFGLATQLASPGEQHFTLCGTPNYISPYVYTAVCTYILPYVHIYCRTYICTAMRTKIIAIVGICHRSYTHYTLYKSCLPICGIVIIRLLSFLFFDDFEGNANISVAIKSSIIYIHIQYCIIYCPTLSLSQITGHSCTSSLYVIAVHCCMYRCISVCIATNNKYMNVGRDTVCVGRYTVCVGRYSVCVG